jgi:mRNA interferase MazF
VTLPARGEIWWCEPPAIARRPVVVLSRDRAISARRVAIVAPCSTTLRGLPSEIELDPTTDPVPQPCVVALDALESLGVGVFVERIGMLAPQRMRELCAALAVAVDC